MKKKSKINLLKTCQRNPKKENYLTKMMNRNNHKSQMIESNNHSNNKICFSQIK